jgi:hypothetical protein
MAWSPQARAAALAARRAHLKAKVPKTLIPYARVNKRSQTVGYNVGAKIPGTGKRIVTGQYVRVENVRRQTAVDRFVAKGVKKVAPPHTKQGKALGAIKKNVSINNPSVRAKVGGHQVRLGTSRGAGPTVIIRRGKHKTPQLKSKKGVQAYDKRMRTVAGQKAAGIKHRPQRRRAARKK